MSGQHERRGSLGLGFEPEYEVVDDSEFLALPPTAHARSTSPGGGASKRVSFSFSQEEMDAEAKPFELSGKHVPDGDTTSTSTTTTTSTSSSVAADPTSSGQVPMSMPLHQRRLVKTSASAQDLRADSQAPPVVDSARRHSGPVQRTLIIDVHPDPEGAVNPDSDELPEEMGAGAVARATSAQMPGKLPSPMVPKFSRALSGTAVGDGSPSLSTQTLKQRRQSAREPGKGVAVQSAAGVDSPRLIVDPETAAQERLEQLTETQRVLRFFGEIPPSAGGQPLFSDMAKFLWNKYLRRTSPQELEIAQRVKMSLRREIEKDRIEHDMFDEVESWALRHLRLGSLQTFVTRTDVRELVDANNAARDEPPAESDTWARKQAPRTNEDAEHFLVAIYSDEALRGKFVDHALREGNSDVVGCYLGVQRFRSLPNLELGVLPASTPELPEGDESSGGMSRDSSGEDLSDGSSTPGSSRRRVGFSAQHDHLETPIDHIFVARGIYDMYLRPGAPRQLSCPQSVGDEIKERISLGQVTVGLFDAAEKHALSVMRFDILPKFIGTLPSNTVVSAAGAGDVSSQWTLSNIFQDKHLTKSFLEFCKASFCEENAVFYGEVTRFRAMVRGDKRALQASMGKRLRLEAKKRQRLEFLERAAMRPRRRASFLFHGERDEANDMSGAAMMDKKREFVNAATALFEKYMRPGAVYEISVPASIRSEVQQSINAGFVESTMFDTAQKHCFQNLLQNVYPRYVDFKHQTRTGWKTLLSKKPASAERLHKLLSGSGRRRKKVKHFLKFAKSIFAHENVLFYDEIERFRARVAELEAMERKLQAKLAKKRGKRRDPSVRDDTSDDDDDYDVDVRSDSGRKRQDSVASEDAIFSDDSDEGSSDGDDSDDGFQDFVTSTSTSSLNTAGDTFGAPPDANTPSASPFTSPMVSSVSSPGGMRRMSGSATSNTSNLVMSPAMSSAGGGTEPHHRRVQSILKGLREQDVARETDMQRIREWRRTRAEQAVAKIQQPAVLTKYNAKRKPVARKFVVSDDGSRLLWDSPDATEYRHYVELADVIAMYYGPFSERFKYFDCSVGKAWLCFVVEFEDRTFDIVCEDVQQLTVWFEGLQHLAPLNATYMSPGALFWQRANMILDREAYFNDCSPRHVWAVLLRKARKAVYGGGGSDSGDAPQDARQEVDELGF